MAEKSKKPAIRFAGFTDAWEQCKLGDIVDVCSGRDYKHLSEGNIPVYGTGGYMLSVNSALSYKNDAIGIGRKGTIDKPYILNAPFWTVDTLFYAIPRENNNLDFIFDIFQIVEWKSKDESTGVPSLSKNAINNIDILAPKYDEQRIVGSYFSKLDNLITLHQRKYDKLVNVKKAMLEKMFPKDGADVPEIRFKGFTEAWEQRKLGDLALRESTTVMSSDRNPSIEYEDVVSEEGRLNKDIQLKDIQKNGIAFNGSQVLYGKLRPYLHNWLNPNFSGVAVGDWWVLKPNKIDKNFLYRLIQTQKFDDVANQSAGSKMPRADWNLVSNTIFDIPHSVDEQSKIAKTFTNLDNLITLHQRKLEKLKNLKKACLEKMFV